MPGSLQKNTEAPAPQGAAPPTSAGSQPVREEAKVGRSVQFGGLQR
jgi:hypothetical protein